MKIQQKIISLILFLVLLMQISCSLNLSQKKHNYIPKGGYVQDKEIAIKIAEAIWLPIYGKDIYNCQPFEAKLVDNEIWIVKGTLPPKVRGGVPYIEIRKSDCKILRVTHGA